MATTFYRTSKGHKAHASEYCALTRRRILTGMYYAIPADELPGWAGCMHCCSPEQLSFLADAAAKGNRAAKTEIEYCPNRGVTHKNRIQSACRDCGKFGKVTAGALRKHVRMAA